MSPMSAVYKPPTKSINQHFTIFFYIGLKKDNMEPLGRFEYGLRIRE